MPWTAKDASEHTKKADTDAKAEQWAAVANSALSKCMEDGGDEESCAASAIQQANGVIAKEAESMPDTKMTEYELAPGAKVQVLGEMDGGLKALALSLIQLAVAILSGGPESSEDEYPEEPMESAEVAESDFAESAIGHALTLTESAADPIVPLHLDVALITPGWGNRRDNYYYPAEVIRRDVAAFDGVKMFESDHRDREKSTRTWVSTVKGIKGFTDDGAPIAEVSVHDRNFAERLIALNADGLLGRMECSILASGQAKKGFEMDGRKGRQVESITSAESVDWVTRAGAGGRALSLAESEGGLESMDNEEEANEEMTEAEEATEEATFTEQETEQAEPEQEAPAPSLDRSVIREALAATRLPAPSVLKLAEMDYADEAGLQDAIKAEIAEVKAATGSGRPFYQGEGTAAPAPAQLSEAEKDERFNSIMRQVGAREV